MEGTADEGWHEGQRRRRTAPEMRSMATEPTLADSLGRLSKKVLELVDEEPLDSIATTIETAAQLITQPAQRARGASNIKTEQGSLY